MVDRNLFLLALFRYFSRQSDYSRLSFNKFPLELSELTGTHTCVHRNYQHGPYRRESDDEWVAVDFSYYPDLRPMDYRTPLKDDEKYVDDYFFITNQYIIITENTNRIRDPEVYYADGGVIPNIFFPTGSLLSRYS